MSVTPELQAAVGKLIAEREVRARLLAAELQGLRELVRTLDAGGEAATVEMMLLLYLDTGSAMKAARALNDAGVRLAGKNGPRQVAPKDVYEVVGWEAMPGDSPLRAMAQAKLAANGAAMERRLAGSHW